MIKTQVQNIVTIFLFINNYSVCLTVLNNSTNSKNNKI